MEDKIEKFKDENKLRYDNKYDYSLVIFKNIKDNIKISCPIHGVFEQRVDVHNKGTGCKKCYLIERGNNSRLTTEDFIKRALLIHGNKYNYKDTKYSKNSEFLNIHCNEHGIFNQLAGSHLHGSGCPICKESKGEREIRLYLEENNIKFIPQNKFPNCKNKRPLPFDFYLPDYNLCIEYNGIQHYEPVKYFGGKNRLEKQQYNDLIKAKYCCDNNINLLRIPFDGDIIYSLKNFLVKSYASVIL